jgi:hypothetical protein
MIQTCQGERSTGLPAAGMIAVIGCAMCCGCAPRDVAGVRPLVVVVSGDAAGWIVPCGCASNQSGGLPRRASYVEELREQADVILVDAGGAPSGASLYDFTKFKAILKGEQAMDVAAHNIGQTEAALGPARLRVLVQDANAPLISANACDSQGRLVAEPFRIATVAGRRVAIVGVLSERYATSEIQVAPPRQAAVEAIHQTAGCCDSVIVLAYLPEDELRLLAESLPEADVVAGGPTGQPMQPRLHGPTLLVSATRQGKFLARLEAPLVAGKARWSGNIVELDDRFADDPEQLANLRDYYNELARMDLTPRDTLFSETHVAPPSYGISGNARCAQCHLDDQTLWKRSKHAQAWEALRAKGSHFDPDCQRCHTLGYGMQGGFESVRRSADRVNVGCESCHGPSQSHSDNTKAFTPHRKQAKDQCRNCHDLENSPNFKYEEYWPRIAHGDSPALESPMEKTSL